MKYFLILLFFSNPWNGYGQEWSFKSSVGYATGEARNFKKIMLANEKYLSYEMGMGREFCFVISGGLTTLKFSHDDTTGVSVFYNRKSLTIPLSIKKYYLVSRNSKAYIDLAAFGSYVFSERKEFRSKVVNETKITHGLGYYVGMGLSIGYKIGLSKTISFDINYNGQIDYFNKFNSDEDKIKTKKALIGITVYKNLNP